MYIQLNSGLTLLEVLVCLLLFSIGILGIINLQAQDFQQIKAANYFNLAINQASNAAEMLAFCGVIASCISTHQTQWQAENKLLLPNASSSWNRSEGETEIKLSWETDHLENNNLLIKSYK